MELPVSFVSHIRSLLPADEAQSFFEAVAQSEPSVSIRINEAKSFTAPENSSQVPWSATGRYLPSRPVFTADPLFHAGCYYVQEASSMFLEQAMRQTIGDEAKPMVMLDLCAAPGGKSTLARTLLPKGSLLVANEVMRNRAQILAENLTKWGYPDVVVTGNDPADFTPMAGFFDMILVDAPCSGEGMFRKDPVAVSEWSDENVDICSRRQHRIVSDIWPTLKPGGTLIYSTCTYNTKEDEEIIRWMRDEFGAEIVSLEIPEEWKIKGNLLKGESFPVYRFMPHLTRGEGIFMAVVRKPGTANLASASYEANSLKANKTKGNKKGKADKRANSQPLIAKEQLTALRRWLLDPERFELLADKEVVRAFPVSHLSALATLKQHLYLLQAGVQLAELKGRDWVPGHALAMSTSLAADAFPREALTREAAIAYLRKEAITLSATAPRGIVLVTFEGHPLGFVKNVGNRANNLYPQEWRIRSSYL